MADIEFNDTCVRGFHVYKDVWRPVIGEELRCQREEDNPRAYQKYAMYIESNANLLINGYLPHTTDLMV